MSLSPATLAAFLLAPLRWYWRLNQRAWQALRAACSTIPLVVRFEHWDQDRRRRRAAVRYARHYAPLVARLDDAGLHEQARLLETLRPAQGRP